MPENLLKASWTDIRQGELRFILNECIGGPGQYSDRANNPNTFYLPLADASCQLKLTFSTDKRIASIESGPAFDSARWARVVEEIEGPGQPRIGRDVSFSSFRVSASWRGQRSRVQILPPPPDAPRAPCELAEHPFIFEFPVKASNQWAITNYRRQCAHREMTLLLNVLLAGTTTLQPRRSRHFWASWYREDGAFEVRWAQESFFTNFGTAIADDLSPPAQDRVGELEPEAYYARSGHDGSPLRVPSDLDDSICCFMRLSPGNRAKFGRAAFWMSMASRQWTISFSASFASLVIAVESLTDPKHGGAKARFRDFLEQYASGGALEGRRSEMYALRSDILHGDALMQMDQDSDFGWAPPEESERDLFMELWGLTRIALRNWLKNPAAG